MTWFQIGTPAIFGSPANTSLALTFGAPTPPPPRAWATWATSSMSAPRRPPGSKGQVFVSRDAGGTWANISLGLDGSPVQQIITDPARGSHDAYAVTTTGVFYLPNSILLAQNPTVTQYEWQNITGNLKAMAYSLFGQIYNPANDANTMPYNLTTVLNSIAANWDYAIPNNPEDLTQGYHPVLYVAGNSGVYMSTDNGQTWSLYPETTYGAVAPGGDLPHVNVTSLSLSQGNVAVATGMPALAGPYQTFLFTGTLAAGSTAVAGITNTSGLAAGDVITGLGIPAGTTITAVNNSTHSLTLSNKATVSGSQSALRRQPDGDPGPRPPAGRHLRRGRLRHQPGADAHDRHHPDRPGRSRRGHGSTAPRSSRPPRPPSTASARSPASAAPPGSASTTRRRATRPSGRSSAGSTRRRSPPASDTPNSTNIFGNFAIPVGAAFSATA